MSRYVRPSGDAPEYTDALKAQVERLTSELAHMQTMQKVDQRVFEKLRETQDLAEQRWVELAEVKTAVRKLAAIVMDEYPEGDERFEFAYVTKALMDGPAFCEKLNAAMKEAKP